MIVATPFSVGFFHQECQMTSTTTPSAADKTSQPATHEPDGTETTRQKQEQALDEALADTFPASDPIAIAI
jgi:hypothetical protein